MATAGTFVTDKADAKQADTVATTAAEYLDRA